MGIVQALRKIGINWPGPKAAVATRIDRNLADERLPSIIGGALAGMRFLDYIDPHTEETFEIRRQYRIMLREPAVKAALLGKLFAVASLDFRVIPASQSERDREIASFIDHAIRQSNGSVRRMVMSMGTALIDGISVSEKVWEVERRGRWAGKIVLRDLKPKDVESLEIETDEFSNVTTVRSIWSGKTMAAYDPGLFVIFTNMPLWDNRAGMSDLRAAYRAYWLKDTAWKLRGIFLEKFSGPFLKAVYDGARPELKSQLVAELKKVKQQSFVVVPEGTLLDTVDLAMRGTADYQAAIGDLDREIFLSIQGAFLQALEGGQTGARSIGEVHRSTSELFEWYLSAEVQERINRDVVRSLVDLNYVADAYPALVLEAVSPAEMQAQMEIDLGLSRLGMPLSRKALREFYGRAMPESKEDELLPPAPGGAPMFGEVEDWSEAVKKKLAARSGKAMSPASITARATPRK